MRTKIPRNVVWLGFVSLFNDVASEMIYPIVPIFLTATLGAPMAIVGLIEGVAESTASLLKVFSGWISDLIGQRKPLAVFGYSFSTLSKLFLAIAYLWPVVLFARFIDRFGKGIRVAARDALIADSTEPGSRGAVFGFHRMMDTFGAVCGPLIAIGLMAIFASNYRLIFLISFIPALIGVLILQFFVTEVRKPIPVEKIKIAWKDFGPKYNLFLLVSIIFSLGNSSDVFLILRSKDLGLSAMMVVLAYVVYNIFYATLSYPAGIMADKIGFKKVLLMGFLIYSFVYAGFGATHDPQMVWPLFAIYGFYIAFTEGVSKAYIANLAPKDKVGTAIGLYYTATGVSVLFASLVAGLLWSVFGPSVAFYFGATMALAASIMFIICSFKK
ncbi:MAG: MFS transporter [Candidatus Margulisbacteria bacterium]|nr:MFS transporter [Candidatus Margulisiibacteriota bacterium]